MNSQDPVVVSKITTNVYKLKIEQDNGDDITIRVTQAVAEQLLGNLQMAMGTVPVMNGPNPKMCFDEERFITDASGAIRSCRVRNTFQIDPNELYEVIEVREGPCFGELNVIRKRKWGYGDPS